MKYLKKIRVILNWLLFIWWVVPITFLVTFFFDGVENAIRVAKFTYESLTDLK